MTTELKPCPAGHAAHKFKTKYGFRIVCDDQECDWHHGDCDTDETAIATWNTRPEEDRLRARIAELESLQGDIKTTSDVLQDYDGDTIWQQAQSAVARIGKLEAELDRMKAQTDWDRERARLEAGDKVYTRPADVYRFRQES